MCILVVVVPSLQINISESLKKPMFTNIGPNMYTLDTKKSLLLSQKDTNTCVQNIDTNFVCIFRYTNIWTITVLYISADENELLIELCTQSTDVVPPT